MFRTGFIISLWILCIASLSHGAPATKKETPAPHFSIAKISVPPVIDGKNDDACWKDAAVLTDFIQNDYQGTPVDKQTRVQMAYDDTTIYFYIRCDEPEPQNLLAKYKEKDDPLWQDDCVEIFISLEHGRTLHWIVNSLGALYDEEYLIDDQSANGYVTNEKWNSTANVKTHIGKDYWATEMAIRLKSITPLALAGAKWKINFNREDHVENVNSTFSRLVSGFYQPKRFSELAFSNNGAILTRRMDIDTINPLSIHRPNALFQELLTNEPGRYTAYIWDHNHYVPGLPKNIREKFTEEQWKEEILDMLRRKGEAGIGGDPLPWAVDGRTFYRTEEFCINDYEKYGTKRKYNTESSWASSTALKNGAENIDPNAKNSKGAVSLVDPIYVDVVMEEIVKAAKRFKDKPFLWTVEGKDEPYIHPIQGKIADMGPKMQAWNEEVRTKYGFGKYSMPAPDDPSYWKHPETHPFQNIAFARWYSDAYADTKKQMYEALKNVAPDVPYVGNDFWFMSGFIPFDYSVFARYTDQLSGDPYASSAERKEGRGIYNHGFGTKLLRDLGGKPTITVVQAFSYAGYTPNPDDLREWVSQALKNGASRIEYYEWMERHKNRPLYDEILRTAKIFSKMNRVNVPDDPDTAIICSLDSEAAIKAMGDHIYTAYSILGEKIGTWFQFISDRQLERNEIDLSRYKVVYLPLGKYFPEPAINPLVKYVNNGGILVIGDPEAFSYYRDGSSLARYREELVGVKLEKDTFDEKTITITADGKLKGKTYPLKKIGSLYDEIHLAHSVTTLSPKIKILATFSDGKPAVLENSVGKGKVIYFTANPFAPDVVLINSAISDFFRNIQEQAGTKTERPIWRFLLPKN